MLHAIIYDNRSKGGFSFYESTPNFPKEYRRPIEEICSRVETPLREGVAIRYAPLKDGYYLLSVVFRIFSVEEQNRRHYRIVNFLMNRSAAEDFFSTPFCQEALISVAKECYDQKLQNFPGNWDSYRRRSDPPMMVQRMNPSTLYACYLQNDFQAFIGMDEAPDGEINYLLSTLPYELRLQLSFVIGMESAQECQGIRFNFGTVADVQRIHAGGYNGCIGTNKTMMLLQGNNWTMTSVANQAAQQRAGNLLTLFKSNTYPVFRYLIKNRTDFLNAADAKDLSEILKGIPSTEFHAAVAKALANDEITEEESKNLRSSYSRPGKSNSSGIRGWVKEFFGGAPAPAPNPGRGNASRPSAGAGTPARSGEEESEPTGSPDGSAAQDQQENGQMLLLTGTITGAYVPLEDDLKDPGNTGSETAGTLQGQPGDPISVPPAPKPKQSVREEKPANGGQTHTSPAAAQNGRSTHTPPAAAQTGNPKTAAPEKQRREPWGLPLFAMLLGLGGFALTLVLGLKISAAPAASMGVFLITVDGAFSILSLVLSFICGGITACALLRLCQRKKK